MSVSREGCCVGPIRNQCLTLEWFRNRLEAKAGIERWRRHYNDVRPHMSLGSRTPTEFKAALSEGRSPARVGLRPGGWIQRARVYRP